MDDRVTPETEWCIIRVAHGMAWYGVVWCGMAWHGVARCGTHCEALKGGMLWIILQVAFGTN